MTVLNIAYNKLPRLAAVTSASSEHADRPHTNLFYGGSGIYWETDSTETSATITLDMGSGNTYAAEYFICRGINMLIANKGGATVDVELRASTDDFSASDVLILEKQDVGLDDLVGPRNEDLIVTGSLSTAYRYWQLKITSTSAITYYLRKFYFGEFFNFNNRSPRYPYDYRSNNSQGGAFQSDSGVTFSTSRGRSRRELTFNWYGFSDSVRDTYTDEIEQFLADYPIIFYAPDTFEHNPIANTLLCAWVQSNVRSGDNWKDENFCSMNVIEDLVA